MTWLRALWRWLYGEPALLFPFPSSITAPLTAEPPQAGRATEIEEGERQAIYALGLAQGELRGRMALAGELEAQFGPDGTQDMTADAAVRVRLRQLH